MHEKQTFFKCQTQLHSKVAKLRTITTVQLTGITQHIFSSSFRINACGTLLSIHSEEFACNTTKDNAHTAGPCDVKVFRFSGTNMTYENYKRNRLTTQITRKLYS